MSGTFVSCLEIEKMKMWSNTLALVNIKLATFVESLQFTPIRESSDRIGRNGEENVDWVEEIARKGRKERDA